MPFISYKFLFISICIYVGQTRKFASTTYLYSNPDLTGTVYTYKANTTVQILENVSSSVDKVYVVMTGRVAYVNTNAYK